MNFFTFDCFLSTIKPGAGFVASKAIQYHIEFFDGIVVPRLNKEKVMQTKTLETVQVTNDDIAGQPLIKKKLTTGLFAQPSALQLNRQLLANVKSALPDAMVVINLMIDDINKSDLLSNDEKIEKSNRFLKFCLDNADIIVELIEEQMDESVSNEDKSASSSWFQFAYIFEAVKVLSLGALSTGFPVSALVLAAILPSAQAFNASNSTINNGIPPGGVSLCGSLAYCIQGYITDLLQNFTYQFSSGFTGSFTQGQITVDVSGIRNCLSNAKIGTILAKYLENTVGNASVVCDATKSIPNFQITTTIKGSNINDPFCNGFQQAFDPLLQDCIFPSSNWIVNVAVAGGVIGAVAAITAIAIISAKTSCCTKSCCEEEPSSPSL